MKRLLISTSDVYFQSIASVAPRASDTGDPASADGRVRYFDFLANHHNFVMILNEMLSF